MVRGAFVAFVLSLVLAPGAAAQSETEVASLERIAKLEIVVAELEGTAAADLGVTTAALSNLLDARLREAGLPVAGFAVAYLHLDVTAIPLEVGPDVVLHTALSFYQPAASTLNRWLGPARTWSLERLTVTGMSRAGQVLRADVEHLATAFVDSWMTANPGRE